MLPTISFNPAGERLWVDISMEGLYFITYTYQLWSADASEPPVLTTPMLVGNNAQPHDDHYPIQNDYKGDESLQKFGGRTVDVRFWVTATGADDGYHLKVTIKQGNDFATAAVCGAISIPPLGNDPAKVGDANGTKREALALVLTAA